MLLLLNSSSLPECSITSVTQLKFEEEEDDGDDDDDDEEEVEFLETLFT